MLELVELLVWVIAILLLPVGWTVMLPVILLRAGRQRDSPWWTSVREQYKSLTTKLLGFLEKIF